MPTLFDQLLQHVVAPIVLISGVGLILLSLNNRYSNALARTREISSELSKTREQRRRENLKNQTTTLLRRCSILQLSIAMVVSSTILSSLIVLILIIALFVEFNANSMLMGILFLSCVCIVAATVLFFVDVVISLQAVKLEVDFSLNQDNK